MENRIFILGSRVSGRAGVPAPPLHPIKPFQEGVSQSQVLGLWDSTPTAKVVPLDNQTHYDAPNGYTNLHRSAEVRYGIVGSDEHGGDAVSHHKRGDGEPHDQPEKPVDPSKVQPAQLYQYGGNCDTLPAGYRTTSRLPPPCAAAETGGRREVCCIWQNRCLSKRLPEEECHVGLPWRLRPLREVLQEFPAAAAILPPLVLMGDIFRESNSEASSMLRSRIAAANSTWPRMAAMCSGVSSKRVTVILSRMSSSFASSCCRATVLPSTAAS
nr:hypothetical protein Itr_chr10CG10780 [Ipomoea trifida]